MRIIVNADDFGKSVTINKAIVESFEKGYIQQTTIMANMPAFDDAVVLSKEYGFFDRVGLHLNLDEGEPLTDEIRSNPHFCSGGIFHDMFFRVTRNRFCLNKYDYMCIKQEINAQMNRYLLAGFPLMHFDSHHFVHNNISVFRIAKQLGLKMGFKSARITEISAADSTLKHLYKVLFNKYVSLYFQTTGQFLQSLNNYRAQKGDCEFMTHPSILDGNLVDVLSNNPLKVKSYEEHYRTIQQLLDEQ